MDTSPPKQVVDLVEHFSRDREVLRYPDYKEDQLRDSADGRQLTAYSLGPSDSDSGRSAVSRKPMAATDGSQLAAHSPRLDSDSRPSAVSRWPLALIIGSLYYPDCPYEFSVLPADILGEPPVPRDRPPTKPVRPKSRKR
jgi:hypothetical protein